MATTGLDVDDVTMLVDIVVGALLHNLGVSGKVMSADQVDQLVAIVLREMPARSSRASASVY